MCQKTSLNHPLHNDLFVSFWQVGPMARPRARAYESGPKWGAVRDFSLWTMFLENNSWLQICPGSHNNFTGWMDEWMSEINEGRNEALNESISCSVSSRLHRKRTTCSVLRTLFQTHYAMSYCHVLSWLLYRCRGRETTASLATRKLLA